MIRVPPHPSYLTLGFCLLLAGCSHTLPSTTPREDDPSTPEALESSWSQENGRIAETPSGDRTLGHEANVPPSQTMPTMQSMPNMKMDATPSPAAASQTYVCPMHAKVVSDRPGDCPICGMALVKKPQAPTQKGGQE